MFQTNIVAKFAVCPSLSVGILTEQGASQLVILGITKSTRLSTNIAIFRTSS